jgi:hypothetical protein
MSYQKILQCRWDKVVALQHNVSPQSRLRSGN